MTEPIFPDRIADELLAGNADPSALDAHLRGVAEVLAATQQPATAAELTGMDAAVVALQGIVTSPVSAPGATNPSRSVIRMISSRVPKRAAIVAGATLLFAGTAAAAAGGHMPSPWASPRVAQTKPFATTTTSTTMATTTTSTTSTTVLEEPTTVPSVTEAPTTVAGDVTDTTLYPGRDYGLCTAWTNGAPKKADNPAFSYLADEAAANGAADVDGYCELVIADKKAHQDDADTDGDDTETSTTEATNTTAAGATVTSPTMPEQAGGKGKAKGKP